MKKILTITFLIISILSCNNKSKTTNNVKDEITFKELYSIKTEPDNEIEKTLKKHNYNALETKYANQWKSESTNDIIQLNDKVIVFLTYNLETYNKLVNDLKKSSFRSTGKTIKNGIKVDSYVKENETIFLSNMNDPSNNKTAYSLTFLK